MKQYLTPEQTAKLIELGLPMPMSIESFTAYKESGQRGYTDIDVRQSYSIGELLSFLPKEIDNGFENTLHIFVNQGAWEVEYSDFLGELYSTYRAELIDAVFDICVKLKEDGVI